MASVLHLDRSEVLDVNVPPYIDPTERGSYDTDELDALIEEAAKPWAKLDVAEDGRDLALAQIRLAYGAGYLRGVTDDTA